MYLPINRCHPIAGCIEIICISNNHALTNIGMLGHEAQGMLPAKVENALVNHLNLRRSCRCET